MLCFFSEFIIIIIADWVWRSLVARMNGVHEAGSSSLLTQTTSEQGKYALLFCFAKEQGLTACSSSIPRIFSLKISAGALFLAKRILQWLSQFENFQLATAAKTLKNAVAISSYCVFLLTFSTIFPCFRGEKVRFISLCQNKPPCSAKK